MKVHPGFLLQEHKGRYRAEYTGKSMLDLHLRFSEQHLQNGVIRAAVLGTSCIEFQI